uniref:ABC transporter permease n=1 Tax=Thermosporothrix sp. COM3 TaxID=2490863 RepID=A0A455SC18_9CHLR|nr:hypothetical protein KTC_00570 [Thermosporothrix sp. COM3]
MLQLTRCLLICANLLAIDDGLPFYLPLKAVGITAGAFLLLFIVIALSTSLLVRKGTIAALVKSEETPKPEPKASIWLALLAVILIGSGYAMAFVFALRMLFSFALLAAGVGLVILGTYFLFTQLSVYVIRALKRNQHVFFRKTNLLTLSELTYRMKDNAVMFFLVSIISTTAFSGIGTTLAIGDPGLAVMSNPYAFTYSSGMDNPLREQRVREIENELTKNGYPYRVGSYIPDYTDDGATLVKLSDYNNLLYILGHGTETLSDEEAIAAPTYVSQRNNFRLYGFGSDVIHVSRGTPVYTLHIKKAASEIILPSEGSKTFVVSDAMYGKLFGV